MMDWNKITAGWRKMREWLPDGLSWHWFRRLVKLALGAAVLMCVAGRIDGWLASEFLKPLDFCLDLLREESVLAWALLLVLGYQGVVFIRRVWETSCISLSLIVAVVCAGWFVYCWPGEWLEYSVSISSHQSHGVSLQWLILLWGAAVVAAEVIKILRRCWKWIKFWRKGSKNPRRFALQGVTVAEGNGESGGVSFEPLMKGLPVKAPEYYYDGRKDFASSVATLVSDTDLREEPLTVGITGEWGSGKTLVLNEIRDSLKNMKLDVIEFFPWQSASPSNLIEDFFKTLSSALHKRSRRLGSALESYAEKLIALDLDDRLNMLARVGRFLGGGYVSINSARERIERDLVDLGRKVVVIIDDLDRLDSDELFETLRLVRNTAHFRNMAYILAYDHRYVVSMLSRKGIEDPERYLEKIFKLVLPMPAYENYTYIGVILRQIRRKYGDRNSGYLLLLPLINERYGAEYLLNLYVRNYRQAIGFATFLIARLTILKCSMPNFVFNICTSEWYRL